MDMISGSSLWRPSTHMGDGKPPTVMVSGKGAYVTDSTGTEIFDGTAALWYANLGHGHPELVAAAAEQMSTLETWQIWGGYLNEPAMKLAEELSSAPISPIDNAKVMFGSGGSDSAELAFKLARLHWQAQGKPTKRTILSRANAYHGLHAFGTSLLGNWDSRGLYGSASLVPETGLISRDDIAEVRRQVAELGAENIAAIVAEPIIGSGGVYPPAPGYLEGLRALCDELDILLIFDEVINAFGRTGWWFASQRYGVQPDMTMFAKGITCGYFPLGGLLVAPKIWEYFWGADPEAVYRFGVTYSGHATGCAIGSKVLEIIERDGLLERVGALERLLSEGLDAQVAPLSAVTAVRHEGLLAVVELDDAVDAQQLSVAMRERHRVLVRPIGAHGVVMSPPFISTDAEIAHLVDSLRVAIAGA